MVLWDCYTFVLVVVEDNDNVKGMCPVEKELQLSLYLFYSFNLLSSSFDRYTSHILHSKMNTQSAPLCVILWLGVFWLCVNVNFIT